MKKINCSLIVLLLIFFGCSLSKKEAIDYNNNIVAEQIKVSRKIEELNFCFQKSDQPDTIEKSWKEAVIIVNASIKKISELKPFHNNSELRDSTIKLFEIYRTLLNNEFSEMVKIYQLPKKLYTKEEETRWANLSDSAFYKIQKGINDLTPIQDNFAKKYDIQLKD